MSVGRRVLHWLISPVGLVLGSVGVIVALDEWRSARDEAERKIEYAKKEAEYLAARAADEKATPALFKAIRDKNAQAVRAAIAQGADPNTPNGRGTIPLRAAFLKDAGWPGRRDVIEALLDGGADVNAQTKDGYTALHVAAGRTSKEVVELLLDRGADVNARTKNGRTPLMMAERLEIAELLLARGAKWGTGDSGIDPDGARIREAARKGDVRMIELLLSKGADPNRASKGGGTAIMSAISGTHAEAVRTLLAAGAKVDGKIYDDSGLLHIAAETNRVDIAKLLIAAGADVNAARRSGWTPLHVASSNCYEEFAELLIASGANRNALDKHGKAPLPCYPFANKSARGSATTLVSCRM
jgi:ankyrin repeat protein